MSEADRLELLDTLDKSSTLRTSQESNRVPYRHPIEVCLWHPGGGCARFQVFSLMLGLNGVSAVHSGFIHPRTVCRLKMPTVWGVEEELSATVNECVHVSGLVHEVDFALDRAIDIRKYVERSTALARMFAKNLSPAQLSGHVLLIDDEEIEAKLLRIALRDTRIELTSVTEIGHALDQVRTKSYELVLCDLNLKSDTAEQVVKGLRGAGFTGPIILVTGDSNPIPIRSAKMAGAAAVIEKPFDRAKLLNTCDRWLRQSSHRQAA